MTWLMSQTMSTIPPSPRSRCMLGTKELTKNMKITTASTDTHFTKSTLSVILCCGGTKDKNGQGTRPARGAAAQLSNTSLGKITFHWIKHSQVRPKKKKKTFFWSSWMFCSQFLSSWEISLSNTFYVMFKYIVIILSWMEWHEVRQPFLTP